MDYITEIGVVKDHEDAMLPTQSKDDVGFDIYSVEDMEIPNMSVGKINTGLKFATTPRYPGHLKILGKAYNSNSEAYDSRWSLETKIEGRSGLASRFIFPIGGILDPGYRGPISVCLANMSGDTFVINQGDRIAQFVIRPVLANTDTHSVAFKFRDSQDETDRGDKGFGSSGK